MAQDIYSDNRKQVYDLLKEGGVNGLGSPEEFAATLDDDDNRRQVHSLLSELGVEGLGDYDTFSSTIYNSTNRVDNSTSGQDQPAAVPEAGGVTQPAVDNSRGRVPEENVPAQQPAVPAGASENNVVVDEAVSRSVSAGGQLGGIVGGIVGGNVGGKNGGNNSSNSSQAQEAAVPEEKKEVAGAGELQGDYLVGPWHKLGVTSGSEEVSASNETAQTDGQNAPQFYQEGIVVNNELVTPLEEVKRYNRAHDIPEGSDAEEMQRYHTSVATENMRDYVNSLSKEALALMPKEATVKQRENALNIVTRAVMGKKSKDAARLQQEASWLGVTPEEYWNQFILPNLRDAIGMNAPWNPMGVAEQLQAERDAYNPYIDEYGRPMPTGRVNPMAIQRIERKKQREAIEADVMKTFEEQLAAGKEAAQSKAKDIMVTDYGGQGAQGTVVNFGKMREANQLSAPENAINAAIGRLDELTKGMSEEQRALFGAQMYQQLQGRLVNERKANNTIEQIFKSAFLNSVTGKMTVGAVQTDYENYLDQLAAKAYDPSFMTEVASEVGSFLFDFWTFLGPQAVGGLAARGAVKSAVNKISKDLVARGLGKRQAGRIAEQIASQSLKTKVGSHAISGATTFGLHGFATSPVNTLTQPTGAESTRSLDVMTGTEHQEPTVGPTDIIGRMFTDMGWGAAGGALFGAGAIPEHYITNRFGHGLASSLAGKGASIATNAAGMTGVGALEYYDENGKPMSWSELGQSYLKNVAMFATLDVPGFIASRNAAKKNQYFRENYEITPSDVAKMRDLGFGERLTDIAVKLADPSQELAGRPSRSDVTDVNALKPEDRDITNGLHQLDRLYDEGAITEKEARKWYALLTGDYRRGLNTATAVRAVETDGKHYVEWLDRDGRVIDRQAAKSSEDASTTVQRETWQVQLNQIDALEKRVVADDITSRWDAAALKDGWAAGMSEEYISALRDKESRGEALTEEEQWVLKNNESFRSGLEKMSRGESLSKDEQQSVDATMKLLGKMAGESGSLQDIVMDFESRHGLEHGKLKTILEKRERSTDEQALVEDYVATLQDNILGRERVRPEQFTRKQIEGPSQEETGLEGSNRIIDGGTPEATGEVPERPDYRGEGVALMRDALTNDDGQAVALAGRESRIAEARVARAFGDSALADELTMAVNSDADLDAFIASHENELTAEQRSAVEALSAANERMRGIESAVTELGPKKDQIRAEIASHATEENTVVKMELADGSRVYLRSGDPENEYGTVMVTDAAGQNRQVSTRDIKTIGEVQAVDDLLAAAFNQAVDEYSQRVNDWIDNTALTPGREFTISAAGEEARAVIDRVEGNDVIVRSADNPEETFSLSADEVRDYLREEEQKAVDDVLAQRAVDSNGPAEDNGAVGNSEDDAIAQDIQPIGTGVFGNIYDQFRGKVKAAFDFLIRNKSGDAIAVWSRDDVGDIDLVYGDRKENAGLDHIIEKHVGAGLDFSNEQEMMAAIDDVIENGIINEAKSKWDKVVLEKDGKVVVISKNVRDKQGNVIDYNKNWVVTSFDNNIPKSKKEPTAATRVTLDSNEGGRAVTPAGSSESKITNTPDTGQTNGQENEGGNGNSGTIIDARPRSNRRKASLTPMQQRERALGDYLDFYDYVERMLAASGRGLKVIWGDDPVTGTRGLGAHLTGKSESERRQYIWLLGTKKNGAFYPEQLAEELWQGYREERNDNGLPIDDIGNEQASDAFGVVLDVLRSHNRKESMMREAEERHSDMQRQYDEAERDHANNWAIGQGYKDIDEWQADYEQTMEHIKEIYADYEAQFINFAEEYADREWQTEQDYNQQRVEELSRDKDRDEALRETYEQENDRRSESNQREGEGLAGTANRRTVRRRDEESPAVVRGEQEISAENGNRRTNAPARDNQSTGVIENSPVSLGTGTGEGREVGRSQSGNLPASVAPLVAELERQSDERDALHQAWLSGEINDSENQQRLRALDEQMSELRRRIIPLLSSLSQEELDAISAYGEEHQLVELPTFVEDEERRRKVAKTEADRFAEGLEAQGNIPHGKAVAKFKARDFASKDSKHTALGGTYYDPDGYAVTTDGFVLIADKQRYDPTKEGKVIAERNIPTVAGKGMEINAPYPNWKAVIPTGGQRVSVDWNDLLGFIAGVRAKMKVEYDELRERGDLDKTSFRAYTANATVQVRLPNGEIALFDMSRLERMAAAGAYLGTTELQYKGNDRAVLSANANGTALVMPMNRIPDEATSFYYDMSGSDMVGEPEAAYNQNTANERFNEELESLTEENAREVQLDCGRPNDILLSCGIENKPIRLYGAKLISKAKKHGYDYHDIKNLPQAIGNPIAVFEGSQKGSFAILTELQINGDNVLVTLTVGKGGHDVDFNIITSVYGKTNNNIVRWINGQKLLYANKEKALDYISVPAPIAGAQSNQELQSAAKVIESFENPKLPKRNLFSGEPDAAFNAESEEIFNAAKEKFGRTYDIREAGYVLPDGTMLDFSGRHELDKGTDDSSLKGSRSTDHREIRKIAYKYDNDGNEIETGIETTMPDFIKRGGIRIDDNAGTINLAVKPTPEQREVLRRLIQRNDGDVSVDFGDGWDSDHYVEYEGVRPQRVLADIDRYFDEGIKPEGNVMLQEPQTIYNTLDGQRVVYQSLFEGESGNDNNSANRASGQALANEIGGMSDAQLLGRIGESGANDRDFYADEYDRRHEQEYDDAQLAYAQQLEQSNTSLDDAYGMYGDVSRRWLNGGYATDERTALRAQMDALTPYIDFLETERFDEEMEAEREAEREAAKQQYEEQKDAVEAFDPTTLRLRKLEPGETCRVERVYEETGQFNFTGKEKIESAEDVAFIFKQLETASVENTFLVMLKDGRPTIVHLGIGSYNKALAPFETAFVAYQKLQPESVVLVHNHPSGNVRASAQDINLQRQLVDAFGADVVKPGIIINTTSGKYGEFYADNTRTESQMPQAQGNEIPIKVYQFSKQVFAPDWNPAEAFKADGSLKVAQFVSSHRLGEHKKMSLLVVTQDMRVVANVFLPWTKLSEIKSYAEAGDLLAGYVHQCGGVRCILYGNYDYTKEDDNRLSRLSQRMKQLQAPFLEVMHIGHSAFESGLLGEPEVDYNAVNEPQYQLTGSEDVRPATQEEREETAYMADHFNAIGIPTSTDWEEGQRVLDMANGKVTLSRAQKRALETAPLIPKEGSPADISNADSAKVQQKLETLAKNLEKVSSHRKNFLDEVADALGAKKHGSNSRYVTIEAKNGKIVAIRLSNHNATVSTFDKHDEGEGISIVVSPRSNQGMNDDGNAHIVEFFYPEIAIRKAEGKPLAEIVRSIEQSLYSGEYKDTTGLAEVQEVNANPQRPSYQKANVSQAVFVSNARRAVEGIRQEKATPEQWLAMLQKQGGLKAGEDKWLGLSDWLKGQDKKSLTKQEVLDFIDQNQIQIEEVNYSTLGEEEYEKIKEFQDEFKGLIEEKEQEGVAIVKELEAFDDEMYAKYGAGWGAYLDRLSEEDRRRYKELEKRYDNSKDPVERAWEEMIDRKGDDFRMAFKVKYSAKTLEPLYDMDGNLTDAAKYFLGMENTINNTRLEYTTEGLENKREIALTVPTIEPWNENDDIHFGDAGGGRAVAWIRFGETTDKDGNRVLVIDEIQSKRHQEGREKGYRTTEAVAEEERLGDAVNKAQEAYDAYTRRMGEKYNGAYEDIYSDMTDAERAEADRLKLEVYAASERFQNHGISDIPDAPFEKNWHELAMKRMLRYAAENGYDRVAWTKGEQQANRYDLSKKINFIFYNKDNHKLLAGTLVEGSIDYNEYNIDETVEPEELSKFIGKDLALKVLEKGVIQGEDLRIGGEGMKGFYDRMLPSFVNKYVKKWGAKVGEVALPGLEEAARKMWSVDVTPEMKRDVMQGQPMFFRTPDGQAYGFTLNGKIYLDPRIATAETPIHEYGHLWVEALAEANPEAWEHLKGELEQDTDLVDYVKGRYPDLEGDELWEEVFTHFSGRRGRERMEEERRRMMNEEPDLMGKARVARMFYRLRRALKRFWTMARDLFAGNNARLKTMKAEDFADAMMADLVHKFNPRTGELAEQRIRRMADKYAPRYQFVGERGARQADLAEERTHRIDNLTVAREMEDAGKDAVAIKLATGWERGGDGKWRYEIPDIDRETVVKGLREPIKAHRKAVNDMERQEERLQGQAFSVSYKIPKRLDSRFTEEEKAKYRQMREKAAALEGEALSVRKEINALKDKVEKEGYETTLGDVLGKDSELIKAYPSLADVKVKVFEHLQGKQGSYSSETNTLELNAGERSIDSVYSTMLHEIQHAIQHIEGFARGGNLGTVLSDNAYLMNYRDNLLGTLVEVEKQLKETRDQLAAQDFSRYTKEALTSREAKLQLDSLNINHTLDDLDNNRISQDIADRYYRRLGGEVEARNVQRRRGYSEEERRRSLAVATEDVDRNEQHFLFGEEESKSAAELDSTNSNDSGYSVNSEAGETLFAGEDGIHYEAAPSRRGKPRKRQGETQLEYVQRLRDWERLQQFLEDHPRPLEPEISQEELSREYNDYRRDWMTRHGLPEDYVPTGVMPERLPGESDASLMERVRLYEQFEAAKRAAGEDALQDMFLFEPASMRRWREAYQEWKIARDQADTSRRWTQLYDGEVEPVTRIETEPMTEAKLDVLEAETMGESIGMDVSPEGVAREMKYAIIERRKTLESRNAEDALFIHDIEERVKALVKAAGKDPSITVRSVLETLPLVIEAPRATALKARGLNANRLWQANHLSVTEEDIARAETAIARLRLLGYDPEVAAATPEVIDAAREVAEALNGEDRTDSANSDNSDRGYITSGDVLAVCGLITARTSPDMSPAMRALMDSAEVKQLLQDIKDWYDNFYHQLEDANLKRPDVGYIGNGYINHVWDKAKSDPEAWARYVENRQRTTSPNMRRREIDTYLEGMAVGLVPKYRSILDILGHYSRQNNEAIANRQVLDDMTGISVIERNKDGEIVARHPVLSIKKPRKIDREQYYEKPYYVPGIGDVWVHKAGQHRFATVFGSMRHPDIPEWLREIGRLWDASSRVMKTIQLSYSFFHHFSLSEVAGAQMRPDRALRALFKYIIIDSIKAGTIPAYAHPDDFKLAAKHLVQLGATQDFAAADTNAISDKVQRALYEFSQKHRNLATQSAALLSDFVKWFNEGMDKLLWSYLHDGLKIACFKMMSEQIERRLDRIYGQAGDNGQVVAPDGLSREQLRDRLLDEAGRYVNDTFGGQYWELLNVTPAQLKWMRRCLLSPDWLLSTQRHFLANFGVGSLYTDSGFKNYIRYNWNNLRRLFGQNVPRDEYRRLRSRNAKLCYLLGVGLFYYGLINALNALFRAGDEAEEKEKADEIRKTNPDYKSPYELAYPNGMKWYDYMMPGNTIGQQTHLYLGRYKDGSEWYARWGKQFREFPEMFVGRHGVEFPGPMLERMMAKSNPMVSYIRDGLGALDVYGYLPLDRGTSDLTQRYGRTIGFLAMTAKHFLPFSVPTREDKEFKMWDLVMPSSKGFSRYKAVNYFKTYIEAGDMVGIERTYQAAVMNGIDAEECLKAAISTVKATQREELKDGIVDLQSAMSAFDAARQASDRQVLKTKLTKYLAGEDYKTFTRADAREKAESFIKGEDVRQTAKDNERYLVYSTSDDVVEDYRVSALYKKTTSVRDRWQGLQDGGHSAEELKAWYTRHKPWFDARKLIGRLRRDIGKLKRQLGTVGNDDAQTMAKIRQMRRETMERIDSLSISQK